MLNPTDLPTTQKVRSPQAVQAVGVCVFLALAVLAVFGQTAGFAFVNYDDNFNVFENPMVAAGLSVKSVGWAFTHTQVLNWIPLTTLSHMLDCQMFGLHAGGHHLVNVLWHAATSVLLFLVLRRMTGSLWRSAFVAAVFAVHPLRAESVAWVSERKDVLSAFFFTLAMGAYVRYAEEFKVQGAGFKVQGSKFKVFYRLCLVFFVLGLMSKPMVATLPFVLLLLDYWPLRRLQNWRQFPRLVGEKWLLLALAAGSCVATALVPGLLQAGGPTLLQRLGGALVSYVVYVRQMVYPVALAIPYPPPHGGFAGWKISVALVLLVGVTAGVVACREKRPYLLVGWLWYLGMLVPVIGVVQLSLYDHADRYTYLPGIGLVMAGTWLVADLSARWKHRTLVLRSLMMAAMGVLAVCGHIQTSYWKDTASLWNHTLACTSDNFFVNVYLGNDFLLRGNADAAITQYRRALEIEPDNVGALNNLGRALAMKGADADALALYQKALALQPGFADTHLNLGHLFLAQGKLDEAIAQYRQNLELVPDNVTTLNVLGNALGRKGANAEALALYQKALALQPSFADTHVNLAHVLLGQGKVDEAIAQYRQALDLAPANAATHSDLGKALAMKGEDAAAIAQYQKAVELQPGFADAHFNLGNRLLSLGQLDQAAAQYRKALDLNPHDTEARHNLGKALLLKGDFDGALACLEKTTSSSPDPAARWHSLGDGFLQKEDLDLAIACYRQELKINPRSADACANLGLAFFQKGQSKEAMESWQLALEINPDQVTVQNNLAWLLATANDQSLRNGPKAVALAAKASQSSGGANPVLLHTLAVAYAEQGSPGLAAATARRALELAVAQKMNALAATLQKEIKIYEANAPGVQ
jgi:protein O-mannosyl-transferase